MISQQPKVEPHVVRDHCSSAQVPSVTITLNSGVWGLWETSHSEGDTEHSPLQSRRAQRALPGTAVYWVTRWLTLVISKFPSWPQSVGGNSGISATTAQFWCSLDCAVLAFIKTVAGVPGTVRGCPTVPTRCFCTKARKTMSCPSSLLLYKGNKAVSAGSKLARWSDGGGHTTTHTE